MYQAWLLWPLYTHLFTSLSILFHAHKAWEDPSQEAHPHEPLSLLGFLKPGGVIGHGHMEGAMKRTSATSFKLDIRNFSPCFFFFYILWPLDNIWAHLPPLTELVSLHFHQPLISQLRDHSWSGVCGVYMYVVWKGERWEVGCSSQVKVSSPYHGATQLWSLKDAEWSPNFGLTSWVNLGSIHYLCL